MQKYGVNELRKMFLTFFESKGHLAMKSFSLVPHNDKSLLLINSGMAPLKPYFTGQEIPPRTRVTTCQKCIRTGDIENVGKTARHGTFFEMLGNFSFGDYFKKEAIAWTWEFLTEVVGLDPDRLYPSVYVDDDEAWEIWNKQIGIPEERIFRFGKEDNFWEHGSGPCGPCSEVYYDRGEKYGCGKPDCTVGCDCDRYMEIWNNVFTQFDNDGHGNYTELEQKNIDTGMGLERLACIVQDVDSMFDIDTIRALREHVCRLAGKEYEKDYATDVSIRVITDHIRSVTFMISDGIMPSNSGRGYVLRRLLRRACRHGRLLGIKGEFLVELAQTVIDGSKDGYPELEEKKDFIFKVITKEEEQFNKTIDQGLSILEGLESQMEKEGSKVLSGEEAFRLYDTYGFPVDLTREILEEKGFSIDEEGFEKAAKAQKERAKGTFGETNYMGADVTVYESIDPAVTSTFVGYDHLTYDSEITVLTTEDEVVDALSDGQKGTVFVKETPFYATSGGQEADNGVIRTEDGLFQVEDTIKLLGGKIGHVGHVVSGMLKVGDKATLEVNEEKRALSARNHSATHLLQQALRQVLGTHVEQAGSSVNEYRLRFDFTHFSALTKEELKKVEEIVNEQIMNCLPVKAENMPIEEAKKTGAAALFGEKYGDIVRVVSMGDFSKEFCGGTHVDNTGVITAFKIISETGVAAGVRRIEALTSKGLLRYYDELEEKLERSAKLLKTTPDKLEERLSHMISENKELHSEVESLKSKLAKESMGDVTDQVTEVKGVKFLAAKAPGADMNGLRDLGDQLKEKLGEGVIVLASDAGGKVSLMATATEGAIKAGAHAGNLIKAIAGCVGGGGGGRPNMAQAGGKNPAGIDEALEKAKEVLENQL
ncbi:MULTISPECIES: alanine--tRNA ligase [Clostridia]|uniref:Alanine--tRNA ligase n=1 Tax=Faecalicatena fissicatena TaxID=290055 RepID=A0ABS2E543_9FIRM|nr:MULTISPECIES: alanine--tRNA ligase [Clostridia]MBM6736737.1 alanine--tRNA ligase [Faecalicatena fissicatena]HIX98392.1 alanine--tRNA ligase [Candidatus Dorea intestinigallinarum]